MKPKDSLTAREKQIIALICCGLRNRRIAAVLGISTNTVKNHLCNIYNKTGTDGRIGLATQQLRKSA